MNLNKSFLKGIQAAILPFVLAGLVSCKDDDSDQQNSSVVYGETVMVGNGKAQAFIKKDAAGNPENIGFNFTEEALNGLPNQNTEYNIPLPTDNKTLVNHISFDFTAHGHEPSGIYNVPHFDVHFYLIPKPEREAITNVGPEIDVLPAAEYFPKDYVPGPGGEPRMGKHWADTTAAEFKGKPFDQTYIYGSYNGKFIFHEPMIALSYLKSKPNVRITIKQQSKVQQAGFYPKSYSIHFDNQKKQYTITLDELTMRSL